MGHLSSDNHESHACIIRDGILLAAISEERLTRIKSDSRYPKNAINKVIEIAGIIPKEIDLVVFAGNSRYIWQSLYNKNAMFSIEDWIKEMDIYWKPILLEGKKMSPFLLFDTFKRLGGDNIESEPYYSMIDQCRNLPLKEWVEVGDKVRRQAIETQLGLTNIEIVNYRHEDCHKTYGFYSSPYDKKETLVLTVEGGGDDSSVTVSTMGSHGEITEHWKSNEVNLGRLYHYVTLILGMKPGQHEYKMMGLAPYGSSYHGQKSLEFFKSLHTIDGIKINNSKAVKDLYFSVIEGVRGQRFDGIAWGIQKCLEDVLTLWVKNCVKHFNISNVVISGGVSQNIKAVKAIMDLPEVNQLWAGPISGDGSLAIGASWIAHREYAPTTSIERFDNIYLGTQYSDSSVEKAIKKRNVSEKYYLSKNHKNTDVAKWLADGKIIARYSGGMEFGQRALGNRSIIADPRRWDSVEKINNKVKYRDFWMPFTPSMTIEQADEMLINNKNIYSPYMTIAFEVKSEFIKLLPAVIHPADKTIRPQMLKRSSNPKYYDLLNAFKEQSGIACVLNTSFNLHGEAIVDTPDDAISTFERSELDILLFDNYSIHRKPI